jgi:hypothetical protein
MFATTRKEPLNHLLRSLQKHGYAYKVIGFGTEWKGWEGRIRTYRDAATSVANPEDLIIFTDAYDIICIKDAEKCKKQYEERPRKHLPIVYGAEWVCYANCSQDVLAWFDANENPVGTRNEIEPQITRTPDGAFRYTRPIFLNGGFIFGPAGKITEYFNELLSNPIDDDQVSAGVWLGKKENLAKGLIDLDLEERFMRVNLERTKRANENGGEDGPAFLHFSGMKEKEEELLKYFAMYETGA